MRRERVQIQNCTHIPSFADAYRKILKALLIHLLSGGVGNANVFFFLDKCDSFRQNLLIFLKNTNFVFICFNIQNNVI